MARSKQQGWHGEDIRAVLRKRHGTVKAFADTVGFTCSAVCKVINGEFLPGPAEAIASAVGVPPSALWPQWFHPDGVPKLGRAAKTARKSKPTAARRHVQTRAAA